MICSEIRNSKLNYLKVTSPSLIAMFAVASLFQFLCARAIAAYGAY